MHYSAYNGYWPWNNFTPKELACTHCGELWPGDGPMPEWFIDSVDALQALRDTWGKPTVINSAHRCVPHNKAVGGSPSSQHLKIAFDCRCPKKEQEAFVLIAENAGFTGIGRYFTAGFVHVDLGPKRRWNG